MMKKSKGICAALLLTALSLPMAACAADVREFNDIVRLAQAQRQAVRSGYVRG